MDHADSGCALALLIGVARDRGNVTAAKLRGIHARVDADALWERLGPIVDDLERGAL
jgi:hypothetical protein